MKRRGFSLLTDLQEESASSAKRSNQVVTSEAREQRHRAASRGELALALPTALAACLVPGLAWREQGSILSEHWLSYALLLAFLGAVVLVSGVAGVPGTAVLAALAGLAGLAVWSAVSALWAPLPAAARDEALLVAAYALALAVPVLTLRSPLARTGAAGAVVAVAAGLGVAVAVALAFGEHPDDRYDFGRLASPIGYINAQGAAFLIAFWPAAALSASRRLHFAVRALAGGAATCTLAAGLLTQSKGGAIALAVSAVVVLAVSPARLRLLVPALGAFVLVAVSYGTLTEPFRARNSGDALVDAARAAGGRVLVLTVLGVALGLGYALLDGRLELSSRLRRTAGRAAAGALVVGVVAGTAAFVAHVDHPARWAADRWDDFKTMPAQERGSSHLVNLGSNRYDFWRVALNEFRDHPVAGIGARGWYVAYLEHGRSNETPRRSHSFELDTASEDGLIGLALLGLALLPLVGALALRARRDLLSAGLFAAAVYFLVHASGDWIWTFPAVGILFFLLVGAGVARDDPPALAGRIALPFAGVAAAIAVFAFAPPWLSARITSDELEQPGRNPHADLTWARRLDPLSTEPLLAESELASGAKAIAPLEDAVDREPRAAATRYLLGLAYLEAGRRDDALRELGEARRLSPRDEHIAGALRRARNSAAPG
jgi:O-antigen ligase/polysaccharide polymerase Wzy-like membrane protein